jgi:LacI family transcriptional regulator
MKKPTQNDVARRANVSQALVSYVLNGNTNVTIPAETRQRILEAIKELGYQPSKTARSLRTSKTYTIAGVIPDILNPFYPAFQRGIQDVADAHHYDLVTYNTHAHPDKERSFCESLLQGRADGLIAVFFHVNAMDLRPLLERGIPVVRLEARYKAPGGYPLDNIYVDNAAASHAAVSYLIGKGHRRIGMLAGHAGPSRNRIAGYRQALTDHAITPDENLIETADFNETGGYTGMKALLERFPDLTAVFASNDLMAIGAMQAIREAGRRVPEDMAVVGFDDIPAARLISPGLTTISQHQEQIGRRAAQMLFERLKGDAPPGGRTESMPFELIIRQSA